MSHVVDHVDEAQLHAYLDCELEFADPEVRKAVGRHIADCSRCSNMLKEVRLVHQQSGRILNVAKPPERPAPTFNEIVQRAEKRRRSMEMQIPTEDMAASDHPRFRRLSDDDTEEQTFELDVLDDLVTSDDADRENPDTATAPPDAHPSVESSNEPFELDALEEIVAQEDTSPRHDEDDAYSGPVGTSDAVDAVDALESRDVVEDESDTQIAGEESALDIVDSVLESPESSGLNELGTGTPDLDVERDLGAGADIDFITDASGETPDESESNDSDFQSIPSEDEAVSSPFEIIKGSAGDDLNWLEAGSESGHNEPIEFITNDHEWIDQDNKSVSESTEDPSNEVVADESLFSSASVDFTEPSQNDVDQTGPGEEEPPLFKSQSEPEQSDALEHEVDAVDTEAIVTPEEEIVFIESHQPVAPLFEGSQPNVEPPVAKQTIAPSRKNRSFVPTLARAAILVIALGATGWFARPYLLDRLGMQTDPTPLAQRAASEIASSTPAQEQARDAGRNDTDRSAASPEAPADAALRSEARRSSELADAAPPPATAPLVIAEPETTEGMVSGTVRDAETGKALAFAQVTVTGTGLAATTNDSGQFTLQNVPPGSLEVGVRMIGYATSSKRVTLNDRQSAQADFDLRAAQIALDEMVASGAGAQPARARAERQEADGVAREATIELTREQAEVTLGGPLVAVDGLSILRVSRSAAGSEIVVEQSGADAASVTITIRSSGNIGPTPRLENVAVTSEDGTSVSTATARYGNYQLTVVASVSKVAMESLVRRITVPPVTN